MQARTAFRLAMLENGYWPLLNDCKRPIEKGWPKQIVDEAEVLSWDRSALASTGMKLDGDLAVIDADVADASLVETLADALGKRFPTLFERGLVRHAGEPKHSTRCLGTAGSSGSPPRYQRREASRRNGSSTRAIQASFGPPVWRTRP